MELIRSLKNNYHEKLKKSILDDAVNNITVSDFDDKLYIAYNAVPLIPIEENSSAKAILMKLDETRKNYINSKMKELCL